MQEYEQLRYQSRAALCHFALKSEHGLSNTRDNTLDTITAGQTETALGRITSRGCAHLHPQPGCLTALARKT